MDGRELPGSEGEGDRSVRFGGTSRYHPVWEEADVLSDVRRGSVAAMHRAFNARVRRMLPFESLALSLARKMAPSQASS